MKAITLLGTLKKDEFSNTETLVHFLERYLSKEGIQNEVIRLPQYNIQPGNRIQMDDDFPAIFKKIQEAEIVIFATPVWWSSHSSELQRVIERMDEVYRIIASGKPSPLDGKFGGVVITGDRDGAESITGNIANFFCCMGLTVPAYCALGVLWEGHAQDLDNTTEKLMAYYEATFDLDARLFAESMGKHARKGKS